MPQLSVHRGRLHRLMVDGLHRRAGVDAIVVDCALQDFTDEREKITVEFFDRRRNRPNGITRGRGRVAADGVGSTGRVRLYPGDAPAHWDGRIVWPGIGPGPGAAR